MRETDYLTAACISQPWPRHYSSLVWTRSGTTVCSQITVERLKDELQDIMQYVLLYPKATRPLPNGYHPG
jgi:hypothetical protein